MKISKRMADAYQMNSGNPDKKNPDSNADREEPPRIPSAQNTSNPNASTETRTKIERVARYLFILDPKESDSILRHMSKEEADTLRVEMLKVQNISPEERKALIAEFSLLSGDSPKESETHPEDPPYSDSGKRDMKTEENPDSNRTPFSFLKDKDPAQLITLCERETAQSIAVMVSFLEPQKSAAVIMSLPPEIKQQVVRRLAAKKSLTKELVDSVEALFKNKIEEGGSFLDGEPFDGAEAIAKILKFLPREDRSRLIGELEAEDIGLGERIKENLFSVEDLIYIDSRGLQDFLEQWNDNDLVYILRDKTPAFVEKIRSNVSSRRLILIDEESDFVGPVRRSEVKERTTIFIDALRREVDAGRIVLFRDENDNDYV